MSKKNKKKLVKISDEKLLSLLSGRQVAESELKKYENYRIQILNLRVLKKPIFSHWDPVKKERVYYLNSLGEPPYVFLPYKEGENILKFASLSDIHVGSNAVDLDEIQALLAHAWNQGVRILLIPGDLLDGINVYRGHHQNLLYRTPGEQVEAIVAIFVKFNFLYIASYGNHDDSINQLGFRILPLIEEKMVSLGKKFVALDSYVANVIYKNSVIQLLHIGGGFRGGTLSDTYSPQRYVDNTFKTSSGEFGCNSNEVIIEGKKRTMIELLFGHYHGLLDFMYGDIKVEATMTTQNTTDFVARIGLRSRIGLKISVLEFDGDKCICNTTTPILYSKLNRIEAFDIKYEKKLHISKDTKKKKVSDKKNINDAPSQEEQQSEEYYKEKLNVALKLLSRKHYVSFSELGLTKKEIDDINQTYKYNIYIKDETVVWRTDDVSDSVIIYSLIPSSGIVSFLDLSNLLIGSKFFSEKALVFMLEKAKKRGVRHVRLAGDIFWGIPKRKEAELTTIFNTASQAEELVRILSNYPEFKFFAIKGNREKGVIEAIKSPFNQLDYVAKKLENFKYVNTNKLDIVLFGTVFRAIHDYSERTVYTRDYPPVQAMRDKLTKSGNMTYIAGKKIQISNTFFGDVRNTQGNLFSGIYVTATAGCTVDKEGGSYKIIEANPEASISKFFVQDGEVLKHERSIIIPPDELIF